MKRKEGASVQVSREREGERERERVCVCEDSRKWGIVYHKNGCWKNGPFWDKLG